MAHSYRGKWWWFQSQLNSTSYQKSPKGIMPEYSRLLYMVRVVMKKCFGWEQTKYVQLCTFHNKINLTLFYSLLFFLSYDHACSYSQHTNHINHLQSTVQNKKDLWSEGSDVALQLKSSVYVCDCVQGLQVAYRFEYFPPIWNPVWLRLWVRNLRHMRTYKQQQPYSIFLHVHDYCKSYLFH